MTDLFLRRWREGAGPIKWEYSRTPFRAVPHATGDPNALVVVRGLDPDLLAPAEYALIAPLRRGTMRPLRIVCA
jgi:hypothetical protein